MTSSSSCKSQPKASKILWDLNQLTAKLYRQRDPNTRDASLQYTGRKIPTRGMLALDDVEIRCRKMPTRGMLAAYGVNDIQKHSNPNVLIRRFTIFTLNPVSLTLNPTLCDGVPRRHHTLLQLSTLSSCLPVFEPAQ